MFGLSFGIEWFVVDNRAEAGNIKGSKFVMKEWIMQLTLVE